MFFIFFLLFPFPLLLFTFKNLVKASLYRNHGF
uniref:Uncharacterized protein n=1 Tax=Rhizophora mucronata TaxID=61149 RepID=A0A2P2NAN5_RHIMU